MTVIINEEVQARFQAVAAPDEDFSAFLEAAAKDALARRERQAVGRAEMRRKYDLLAPSHLTHDELVEQAEAALAALPPEKIAEAERLGLI